MLVATRINNLSGKTFTREDKTLQILERGLTTPYPHEVIYCLHLLEQLQPLHIKELLLQLINHPDATVRVELFDNTIYSEHKVLTQPVLFPRDSPVPQLQAVERIKEIITEVEVRSNAWLRACAIDAADVAIRLSIEESL